MKRSELAHGITAANEGILRIDTFRWILNNLVRARIGTPLIDLGAGACVFARIADAKGYAVTAVDGRTERVPEKLGNIRFVHSDVREVSVEAFEVVLILGLFYHLSLDDQIDLLKKCLGRTVIVDTQVHVPELVVIKNSNERGDFADKITQSPEGYEGVLFPEKQNPMASIGNDTSWWHTEASMERLFQDIGFDELNVLSPSYVSKYGARRWYLAR